MFTLVYLGDGPCLESVSQRYSDDGNMVRGSTKTTPIASGCWNESQQGVDCRQGGDEETSRNQGLLGKLRQWNCLIYWIWEVKK